MTQQPENFQHDIRLRGRSAGSSRADYQAHLSQLQDVEDKADKLEMEQPALAPREREQPRPPLTAAGSPLPPPPPGLITPNPTTLNPFGRPQPTSTFSQPAAIAPLEARGSQHGYPHQPPPQYGSPQHSPYGGRPPMGGAPQHPGYPHQPPPQPLQNPFAPPNYVDPSFRGHQQGYPGGYPQPGHQQPSYPHQPPPQQYGYGQPPQRDYGQPPPRDYGQPPPRDYGQHGHGYPQQYGQQLPPQPPARPLENPFAPSHAQQPQHYHQPPQAPPAHARPLENPFAPQRPAYSSPSSPPQYPHQGAPHPHSVPHQPPAPHQPQQHSAPQHHPGNPYAAPGGGAPLGQPQHSPYTSPYAQDPTAPRAPAPLTRDPEDDSDGGGQR